MRWFPVEEAPASPDQIRIRVVLVEQYDTSWGLLRQLLDREEDMEAVGDAADWREGLRLCQELSPDVVATGLEFPSLPDGYSGIRAVRLLEPPPRIIVGSVVPADEAGARARDVGASAYLQKPFSGFEAIYVIRQVAVAPPGYWYDGDWIGKHHS